MHTSTQLYNVPLPQTTAHLRFRRLLEWSDNTPLVDWLYVVICLLLTCMAGLMSGLTLGLLSLDAVELEVLLRSGTPSEQRYARKIIPLISNSHLLLVSLLMCNAVAMEALPLFLDKLADPITAVIVSVTAVLFFGEIIPQSVCSRYGLAIGARLAPLVRLLMWLCSPVAWPISKLLDLLIGPDNHTLFRRRQLKELVSIHAEDAGMGGALTRDEIKVITGALDLTSKVAYRAMTPLDKVFMLSSSDVLDEATLRSILRSGHSRIPVHREGDRGDVVGLVLVKELLQYRLGSSEDVPVAMLRIRSIPRLPATTRMYDMLRLFQTGRSHIAVLTQPPPGELERLLAMDASFGIKRNDVTRSRYSQARTDGGGGGGGGCSGGSAAAASASRQGSAALAGGGAATAGGGNGGGGDGMAAADGRGGGAAALDDARSVAAETEGDGDSYMSYGLYYMAGGGADASYPPSALDPQESGEAAAAALDLPASFRHWGMPEIPRGGDFDVASASNGVPPSPPLAAGTAPDLDELQPPTPPSGGSTSPPARMSSVFEAAPAAVLVAAAAETAEASPGAAPAPSEPSTAAAAAAASQTSQHQPRCLPSPPRPHGGQRLSRLGLEASTAAPVAAGRGGSAFTTPGGGSLYGSSTTLLDSAAFGGLYAEGGEEGVSRSGAAAAPPPPPGGAGGAAAGVEASQRATAAAAAGGADAEDGTREPEEGTCLGIITIEDVIEELIRSEIVDETDRYVDNNRLIRVDPAQLAKALPEHLAKVLAAAGASKKAAALQRVMSGTVVGAPGGGLASRRSFAAGLGSGAGGGGGGGAGSARDMSPGSSHHRAQQQQPHQPQQQSALRVPLLQAEQLSCD